MDKSRLDDLLEEATVDCYDEEEYFWGIFYTLGDRLAFPLEGKVLGERVTVVGLDGSRSGHRQGVMARVRRDDQEYTVALSTVEVLAPDPTSAEWLAAYRYWLGKDID
jgi:hypothetical protein